MPGAMLGAICAGAPACFTISLCTVFNSSNLRRFFGAVLSADFTDEGLMNAQPIKNILLIFSIGLGRVKGLRNFMTACRNVAHRMGMLAAQCGQAIEGGANMWRLMAGVGEAKITASRRVGFVLLGIFLWGLAGSAYALQMPHRSFVPLISPPGNVCQNTNPSPYSANNPDNPYCLTSLDTFSPGSWERTRYGVLLDVRVASATQSLNAGKLTEAPDDLFISCTEIPTTNNIIPVANSQWNSVAHTVNVPASPCTDSVGTASFSYLFRKLHFNNWLVDFSAKTATMGTGPENIYPRVTDDTTKLIVVIHGWNPDEYSNKFVDQPWDDLIGNVRSAIKNSDWKLSLYHWEKDSATGGVTEAQHAGTEAAEIGHQHGQNLGDLLNAYPNLEKVQFIAHSAGSWVARSAIKSLLQVHPNIKVELTLLDPFIPGEAPGINTPVLNSSIPTAPSNLTLLAMNGYQVGINYFQNASSSTLYLLEDIYTKDGIVFGTDSWLGWRTNDKTLLIRGDFSNNDSPIQFALSSIGNSIFNSSIGGNIPGFIPSVDLHVHPYNNHAGPIQFYSDTVAKASNMISSPNLETTTFYTSATDTGRSTWWGTWATDSLVNNYGWSQSLFYQEPKITLQPLDQINKNIGDVVRFTSAGKVKGELSSGYEHQSLLNLNFQWQKLVNGTWTDIPNTISYVPSSYILSLTLAAHCSQYRVKVESIVNTRSAGVEFSNPATVTIAGQGACQGGGGSVAVTPTIQYVSPLSLNTQASGTQTLTISGTGFTQTSTVNFTFDSGSGPVNVTALNQPRFISWYELKYDISSLAQPGTYTVTVSNGAVTSQPPKTFYVVSSATVSTAPAAPIGLNSFSGNWTKLNQFTLDWTNPASSAGISKVWWKVGAAPTSATDGSVASINSFKPLLVTLPITEGQQDVHVWLEDGAGNRSHLNRATIQLGKDITPPGIAVTSQLTANTTQNSVTLSGTFSDTLSGVSRITWSNNSALSGDAPITPGLSGSWTTQPITLYGGDNYITVTAIDAAGNYTTSAVTIRKTDTTNSGSVMFTLSPPEAVTAGARWRANGGVWHLSGEYGLNVPAGVAQVDFQGTGNYVAPQSSPVIVTAGQVTQRTASFPHTVVNVPPYTPSSPSPANGTAGLSRVNPTFSWIGGGPVGGVDYHFMLSSNPVPDTNPICEFGFGAVAGSSVTCLRTLNSGTTFYWKVAARDATGAITNSPVWSFTTEYAMPDLIVSNVVLNGNVAPGANVTADVTVQNIGNFASYGISYVHVYLSSSPGGKNVRLTPNVPNNVPVLQPGQTQTFSIPVTLSGLQTGTSYLDAWIDSTQAGQVEGNINNNLRSIPLSYLDGQAPSITSAGLQNTFVKTGIANSIYYTATDDTGIRSVDFYYSVDGGTNWLPIEEGVVPATPPAYGTAYRWAIPANLPIVSNLKIRVVARDASGNAGEFIAGPYVVHDGTVPTVTMLSPNGGEIFGMGTTQQVRWNVSSVNPIAGTDVLFYYNGTAAYLNTGVMTGSGNQTYSWTLPNNFSTVNGKLRVRVQDVNGNIAEDYSDGFFTVRDTSAPPPAPWAIPQAITSVPAPQTIGNVQMATDTAGNLHMAYMVGQAIMYTKRTGATWSTPQTVYSAPSLVDLQLTVSNAGLPYLVWGTSYGSGIQSDIYFASFDGSNWSAPFNFSADLPGFVGVTTQSRSPRIQVDSTNAVHIVWTALTGQSSIYYRKRTAAGGWEPAINVIGFSSGSPALAVDGNNTLHLAVIKFTSELFYSSNSGSGWTPPVLVANKATDGSVRLVSDGNNHLHMVGKYYDSSTSKNNIFYSFYDGVSWSSQEIVNSTANNIYQITISPDSLNRPHLTWEDWGYPYKLLYSSKNGNQWSAPIQLHYDSQIVVNYSSAMALSALNNEMHVAWVSTVNGASTILYNHANVGSTTDSFSPSVSVVAPVAGASLSNGSTYDIQWNATDSVGVANIDLHYSVDNGATWILIAANQPNTGTYSWIVPAQASLQVRVTAHDAAGNAGAGFSGTATTSDTTPPAIALTAPTSGTPLVGNSTVNVNWTATDNVAVTRIDLDYSLDSGVTWWTMASSLSNSGSYAWLVPNSPTSALLIRAVAHDAVGYTTVTDTAQLQTIVRANAPPIAPSMPFPLAAGVNVPVLSPMLNWTGGDPNGDALTYQIRFGTTATPPVIATVSNNAYATGTLQYSTQYYWQVAASDGNATTASPVWAFTTEAVPLAVPSVPTAVSATGGNAQATVSFTAPTNTGGSAITGYTVTSIPAGGVDSNAGSVSLTHTITGLTNNTAYTFTVAATNAVGNSVASAVSNSVTPTAPVTTFTVSASAGANGSITPATQTVAQGNATSFTVTPSTGYTASASGCGGSLVGYTYTTGAITANCTISATFTQVTTPIQAFLVTGWNLIGNSVNAPLDVVATLGDTSKVTSVWKRVPATSKWAFYAPSMTAPNLATYAAGKGYDVLATINGGEGFWVNAKTAFTAQLPTGTAINSTTFADQLTPLSNNLPTGWSLIALGDNPSPRNFVNAIAISQLVAPAVAASSVTTLWAWDSGLSNWYFYAPSLDNSGGLANYITTKGYLNFGAKTLDPAMGFWVNHP